MRSTRGSGAGWARVRDRIFRDADGRVVVGQRPNPAITAWAVLTGVRPVADVDADADALLGGMATGALVVWALDELLRGATVFRRVLGAGVLAYQLVAVAGSLR